MTKTFTVDKDVPYVRLHSEVAQAFEGNFSAHKGASVLSADEVTALEHADEFFITQDREIRTMPTPTYDEGTEIPTAYPNNYEITCKQYPNEDSQ